MIKKVECPAGKWTKIIGSYGSGMPKTRSVVFNSPSNEKIKGEYIESGSYWIFPGKKKNGEIKEAIPFHRKWINGFYSVKVKPEHDIIADVPGISHLIKIVLILGFAMLLSLGIALPTIMKSSDAYQLAHSIAIEQPIVIDLLGEHIKDGYLPMGSISTTPSSGTADMKVSLSGSKGEGNLYFKAIKEAGQWKLTLLVFEYQGKRYDIL